MGIVTDDDMCNYMEQNNNTSLKLPISNKSKTAVYYMFHTGFRSMGKKIEMLSESDQKALAEIGIESDLDLIRYLATVLNNSGALPISTSGAAFVARVFVLDLSADVPRIESDGSAI